MERKKKIPVFKTDEERAKFWDEHSFANFIDDTIEADIEFEKKEKTASISVRLPEEDLGYIRKLAKSMGVSQSTLIRVWIKEKLLALKPTKERLS